MVVHWWPDGVRTLGDVQASVFTLHYDMHRYNVIISVIFKNSCLLFSGHISSMQVKYAVKSRHVDTQLRMISQAV